MATYYIMNKEQLHERFEYKDGNLIYKIRCGTNGKANIGDLAGYVSKGYAHIKINKKKYMAHRLIWVFHYGDIPNGMQIDHINQIKDDNRIENLRVATRSQNGSNSTKRKNNKSGFKGVYRCEPYKKWLATITHNKKTIYLGYFDTPELAHIAYVAAATKHQGDFAFTK